MHHPFYLMFIPSIGPMELILLSLLVLILFGPGKLPEVFRSLGDGVKEFKKAANDVNSEIKPAAELKSE